MMIVGFDVSHDVKIGKKSYGALIATMNDSHTSFFNCVDKMKVYRNFQQILELVYVVCI